MRHVARKNFLPNYGLFDERRFFAAGDRAEAVDSDARRPAGRVDLRRLLAPADAVPAGARRRAGAGQHLVLARPRRGGGGRGRSGHGRRLAAAAAHLRHADHELCRLRQPRRRRGIGHLLGRLRGHRPSRSHCLPRATPRGRPVRGRHRSGRPAPRAHRAAGAARRAPRNGAAAARACRPSARGSGGRRRPNDRDRQPTRRRARPAL